MGWEQLENRACTTVSQHVHPSLTHLSGVMEPEPPSDGTGLCSAMPG